MHCTPRVLQGGGVEIHLAGGLDLGRHVGKREGDGLVLDDAFAEGDALAHQARAASKAACATPTDCAATPMRPLSSADSAT